MAKSKAMIAKENKKKVWNHVNSEGQVSTDELMDELDIEMEDLMKVVRGLVRTEHVVFDKDNDLVRKIGRHTGKYEFQGEVYNKSQCAFHVVKAYIKKRKPSMAQLEKAFPSHIVPVYGIVSTVNFAESKSSGGRTRYHLMEDMIMTTKDRKSIVVTNQWSLERFDEFRSVAYKLGFKITAE